MLVIGRDELKSLVHMDEAIDVVAKGFADLSSAKAVVPLRTVISTANGDVLFMPGYVPSLGSVAVKVVSVFPGNLNKGMPSVMAAVVLLDASSGQPLALIEGTYFTALRTGAAGGLAIKLLSRVNASKVLLFGAGKQGYTQVEAAMSVRSINTVWVVDSIEGAAERFCKNMSESYRDIEFVPIKDYNEIIAAADIIITATTSTTPVFDGSKVKDGTHVNAIGAYRPDMQEVDEVIVKRADKLVVDSKDAVLAEAGDIIIPLKRGIISEGNIYAEIGEIVTGDKKGRAMDEEITLFKTVGIAVEDVALAALVYQRALEKGVGTRISGF